MDKSKSKENLRAAGKKRLEEFRQKRLQKTSDVKAPSSAVKVWVQEPEPECSLNDSEPQDMYNAPSHDEQDNRFFHTANESLELGQKGPGLSRAEQKFSTSASESCHGAAPGTSDERLNCSFDVAQKLEESSSTGGLDEMPVMQDLSEEGGQPLAELQLLKLQLGKLCEDKEQISKELVESQLQVVDIELVNTQLLSQIFAFQEQLDTVQGKNLQLADQLTFTRKELQDVFNNQVHLASELSLAQEAEEKKTLLVAELDATKQSLSASNTSFKTEIKELQQQLLFLGDGKSQMTSQIAASAQLIEKLQEENSRIIHELDGVANKLHNSEKEKAELEGAVRNAEMKKEELVSELMVSYQQTQEAAEGKEALERELSVLQEKQQLDELGKGQALEHQRILVTQLEEEIIRLQSEMDVVKQHLVCESDMKCKIIADFEAERAAFSEHMNHITEENIEFARKLEELENQCNIMSKDKLKLEASFESKLEQLRSIEDEAGLNANNLLEFEVEMQRLKLAHDILVDKLKVERNEYEIEADQIFQQKQELEGTVQVLNKQLQQLHKENMVVIAVLESQLNEYKNQAKKHEEEKEHFVYLLDISRKEMSETANLAASLMTELKHQRGLTAGLMIENEKSASEVIQERERLEGLTQKMSEQKSNFDFVLQGCEEKLRVLEENHCKLLGEYTLSQERLLDLKGQTANFEVEIKGHKQELRRLETDNENLLADLEKYRQRCDTLLEEHAQFVMMQQCEIDRLSKELSEQIKDNVKQRAQFGKLEETYLKLGDEKKEVGTELEACQEEMITPKAEKFNLDDVCKHLRLQVQCLMDERAELTSMFQAECEDKQKGDSIGANLLQPDQHSPAAKVVIGELCSQLESLRDASRLLQEKQEAIQKANDDMCVVLETKAEELQKVNEENLRLTETLAQQENVLLGKFSMELETLGKHVVELQEEKFAAKEVFSAAMAELQVAKHNIEKESTFLVVSLQNLQEESVVLKEEKDSLLKRLAEVQEIHTQVVQQPLQSSKESSALQDQFAAVCAQCTEQDIAAQSYMQNLSLLQQEVDSLLQQFQTATEGSISGNLPASFDLQGALKSCIDSTSRMIAERNEVKQQLQVAHSQVAELNNHIAVLEEKAVSMHQEWDAALAAKEQFHLELVKSDEERARLGHSFTEFKLTTDMHFQELLAKLKDVPQFCNNLFAQDFKDSLDTGILSTFEKEKSDLSDLFHLNNCIDKLIAMYNLRNREVEDMAQEIDRSSLEWKQTHALLMEQQLSEQLLRQSTQESLTVKELEVQGLNDRLNECTSSTAQQASAIKDLLLKTQNLCEELALASSERNLLKAEVAQTEHKLSLTREKLSLAVNKGKTIVQQREALKQSLAEKHMELESVTSALKAEIELKSSTLELAELKMGKLEASVEHVAALELELSSVKNVAAVADQSYQESKAAMQLLQEVLAKVEVPSTCQAFEVTDKILWLESALREMEQKAIIAEQELEKSLAIRSSISLTVDTLDERRIALEQELENLKLEMENCVLKSDVIVKGLQVDLQKMLDKELNLTSVTENLKMELQKERETKHEEYSALHAEIVFLQERVSEQEDKMQTMLSSFMKLQGDVDMFFQIVVSKAQAACLGPSLSPNCNGFVERFTDCMAVMIRMHKDLFCIVDEVVLQSVSLASAHEHAKQTILIEHLLESRNSRDVQVSAILRVMEEAVVVLQTQESNNNICLQQIKQLADEIEIVKDDRRAVQLELDQTKQKLSTVKEKLVSAVSRGKAIAEQRGSLRELIAEKDVELQTLKEELQTKTFEISEMSQNLAAAVDHVTSLKDRLSSVESSAARSAELSYSEKILELCSALGDVQQKLDTAEYRADLATNAERVLSVQLKQTQELIESLEDQLSTKKMEMESSILEWGLSNSRHSKAMQEISEKVAELTSSVRSLEVDLATHQIDEKSLLKQIEELVQTNNSLLEHAAEYSAEKASLESNAALLRIQVFEQESQIESQEAATLRCQSDFESAIARMQNIIDITLPENCLDLKSAGGNNCREHLETSISLFVSQYKAAAYKVEKLSNEVSSLSLELQHAITVKLSVERQFLDIQKLLVSRDEELNNLSKKIEDSASTKLQHADTIEVLLQQKHTLQDELVKSIKEQEALRAEVMQTEQKVINIREKLSLAVKKGKVVTQQRDSLKQSLSELELEIGKYKQDLQLKESTNCEAEQELLVLAEQIRMLEKGAASQGELRYSLEQHLKQEKRCNYLLETILAKAGSPVGWHSQDLTEKVEWLVEAVTETQNRALLADQKLESARTTMNSLMIQLMDTLHQNKSCREVAIKTENRTLLADQEVMRIENVLNSVTSELIADHEGAEPLTIEASKSQVFSVDDEAAKARTAIESINSELFFWQEKVISLSSEAEEARDTANLAGEDLQKARMAIDSLTSELVDSQTTVEALNVKMKILEIEVLHMGKRAEENDERSVLSETRVEELKANLEALTGVQLQADYLSTKVGKLEEIVRQKEGAVKALETSRGTAVNKLNATLNKLRELIRQSEALVAEVERLHATLQIRDTEVEELKEEVAVANGQSQALQELLESELSKVAQLEKQLEMAVKGTRQECELTATEVGNLTQLGLDMEMLQKQLENVTLELQAWQGSSARKDVQLQVLRRELEESASEVTLLKATMQREMLQVERLKADVASMRHPVIQQEASQIEEIEESQSSKNLLSFNPAAPHVRSGRKLAPADLIIDMDEDADQLLSDKGDALSRKSSRRTG